MHLTVASVRRMIRGHDWLLASHQREVRESLEFAGRFAQDHVQKYPEFTPRTGRLQRSVKAKVVRTSGGKLLRLGSDKAYAPSIDGGARPHVIVPRNKPRLRFFWKKIGRWVSAKKVNHPGNRPYKFLYRAHNAAWRVGERNLRQRLTRIASRF